MIQLLRWLLFPFTILYTLIIWIRNLLYDLKIFPSKSFDVKSIVIGNLAVGGAGKSPLTQKLIEHFKKQYQVATLSRGYGRKTKGFRLVQVDDNVENVGDEPLQFKKNFPEINVAVDENRAEGIQILSKENNLILLDDAFQHRKIVATCAILVFEYQSILEPIILLPTGQYRDTFNQTKRADIIMISKCPEHIPDESKVIIEQKIRRYNKSAKIFYSHIIYKDLVPLLDRIEDFNTSKTKILLITGIANPKPLVQYLRNTQASFEHLKFPDHHQFDEFDYKVIKARFEKLNSETNTILLTTEKDAQRIDQQALLNIPIFYIPIDIKIDQEEEFFQNIQSIITP